MTTKTKVLEGRETVLSRITWMKPSNALLTFLVMNVEAVPSVTNWFVQAFAGTDE